MMTDYDRRSEAAWFSKSYDHDHPRARDGFSP